MKIAVLASGNGSNLQAIIDNIASKKITDVELVLVLSDKENAFALERAKKAGIPHKFVSPKAFATREEYDTFVADLILEAGAELVCLAGYMRLVTSAFLSKFPNRVINIHPALLPAFPGLDGQGQAFRYGVKYSGCTVHFVDSGMDTGKIIAQTVVPVLDEYTDAHQLADAILVEEHKLYSKVIDAIAHNRVSIENGRVYMK